MKNYIGVILQILVSFSPEDLKNKKHPNELRKTHNDIILSFMKILDMYEDIWV